jgi:hypothetical protein
VNDRVLIKICRQSNIFRGECPGNYIGSRVRKDVQVQLLPDSGSVAKSDARECRETGCSFPKSLSLRFALGNECPGNYMSPEGCRFESGCGHKTPV